MEDFVRQVNIAISQQNGRWLSNIYILPGLHHLKSDAPPSSALTHPILHNDLLWTIFNHLGMNKMTLESLESLLSQSQTQLATQQRASGPLNSLPNPHDTLFISYIKSLKVFYCLLSLPDKENHFNIYGLLFKLYAGLVQSFIKYYAGVSESNWELPILKEFTTTLFYLAKYQPLTKDSQPSDQHQSSDSTYETTNSIVEECARILSRAFTLTITDRSSLNLSKKWASLRVIVLLFKIYFKLNNLRLCSNALRAMENPQLEFPPLESFLKSEWISYKYYRARIHLQQFHETAQAQQLLEDALCHCYGKSLINKRKILIYLIALRMYHGSLPSLSLLKKYHLLAEYGDLVQSYRRGDFDGFKLSLERNMNFFIKYELYLLLLVQIKQWVHRNLFKRIYKLSIKDPPIGNLRELSLRLLLAAFQVLERSENKNIGSDALCSDVPIDLDELECIAANLVANGFCHGKIVHSKELIMFHNDDPFPMSGSSLVPMQSLFSGLEGK